MTMINGFRPPPPPAPEDDEIQFFVVTPQQLTHTFTLRRSAKVSELRAQLHDKTRDAPDEQRLIFGGKSLADGEKTLADYNIAEKSTVHMTLRLKGGF